MGSRSFRRTWSSCVVVTTLLVLAENLVPGTSANQQPQQHWAQQDDDVPAQAPTVHLSTHIIPPPAPRPTSSQHSSSLQKHIPSERGSSDAPRARVPVFTVTWMALAMALMSCLGVVPYLFVRQLSKPWAGTANAIASGVMLAASFGLLQEGAAYSGTHLVAGMLLGVLFVRFSQTYLKDFECEGFEQLAGADARKLILFLAVMAVHAVGEGGGVGVSFAGHRGWAQGTLVTLAIGLHNVPEGLAVATVMAAKGTPPRRILLWTALTALPQALVAPPAYVFVDTFKALLPLALGFAAGCMMWIVFAMLLPDALEVIEADRVATYTTGAAAWLQGLSVFMAQLETPAGTLASPFGDHPLIMHLGMVPLLVHLLPACIVPGLVLAAAANVQFSKPTAVSAAAGLLASYTLASGVHLLWSSEHRVICGVCAPLLGAMGAWIAWRRRAGSGNKQKKAYVSPSHSMLHCDGCDTPLAEGQTQCKALVNGIVAAAAGECVPVAILSAGGSRHRVSAGCEREASFNSWQQQMRHESKPSGPGDVQFHSSTAPYNAALVSPSKSSSSSSCISNWMPSQQSAAAHLGTRSIGLAGSPLLPFSSSSKQHLFGHLPSRNALCLCETNGRCNQLRVFEGLGHTRDSGVVDSACWVALCGAVGHGAVLGVQLAASITAAPDNLTQVTVPLTLLGCMFAIMHMGFLSQSLRSSSQSLAKQSIAAATSSVPIVVTLALLVLLPDWGDHLPAVLTVEVLQGLLLGVNNVALLLLLKNIHKHWGRLKCSAGFGVGLCSGLLLHAGLAVLCLCTHCCLRSPK